MGTGASTRRDVATTQNPAQQTANLDRADAEVKADEPDSAVAWGELGSSGFAVGDYVQMKSDGLQLEGIVVEILSETMLAVDFGGSGDTVQQVRASKCRSIVRSDDLEVGDQVQVQLDGSYLTFVGRVHTLHADGSCDVAMQGDDPDDIERQVPAKNITKLMSRRALVIARWKKAARVISSVQMFKTSGSGRNGVAPSYFEFDQDDEFEMGF
ncbi:hypothetical protein B484DRAFT_400214 [Ochromonadaceae sp. CCMP2298]|nr:hypothetical protein B484DRAFT_400214 [Ochromonadaceae sp. CCMP2298]|mmetsp:Transcript_14179/g.31304  ORF Transcript_14179/g.31304 Transcript_14179/m.31304 type:complete len:212 (+) Transcript_14179:161-796(+)|eukprot:CAMPEP_0173190500 /NCGR_PEP_ID=MMETSP1141-20130122/12380_1 /TAXON_ID=483371 /ORGANISM="non described non described, Strain CCMP2298" /LENGTH=211 /DNA_ID=CAMNT_0014114617 /DNA_START=91 /DNA_END=726 /DNA_ORIENTATION=-